MKRFRKPFLITAIRGGSYLHSQVRFSPSENDFHYCRKRRFKDSKSVMIQEHYELKKYSEILLRRGIEEENLQLKMKTSFCAAEAENHLRRRFKTYSRDGSTHHGLTEDSLPSITVDHECSDTNCFFILLLDDCMYNVKQSYEL